MSLVKVLIANSDSFKEFQVFAKITLPLLQILSDFRDQITSRGAVCECLEHSTCESLSSVWPYKAWSRLCTSCQKDSDNWTTVLCHWMGHNGRYLFFHISSSFRHSRQKFYSSILFIINWLWIFNCSETCLSPCTVPSSYILQVQDVMISSMKL